MDLQGHASEAKPEWGIAREAGETLNIWQQWAEKTHGWLTRANAATVLGTAASVGSAVALHYDKPVAATALTAADGLLDLGDGALAAHDKVRSPLGKKLDAGSDKVRMPLQVYTAWKFKAVPTAAALLLGGTEAAIAIPSSVAIANGNEPEVSSAGKIKSLAERMAAGGFLLAKVTDSLAERTESDRSEKALHGTARALRCGSWLLTGTAVVYGLGAAKQSARAAGWTEPKA